MRQPFTIIVAAAIGLGLSGCASMDDLMDPTSWFNSKKPLPGNRRSVFPEGVPGVPQGVPPELVEGYQPPPEPPPPVAEAPPEPKKPRPKPKKSRLRRLPPGPPPSGRAPSAPRDRRRHGPRRGRPAAAGAASALARVAAGVPACPIALARPAGPLSARCRLSCPAKAGHPMRHELHRRHRRSAERRQVDPVQPAGRPAAGAGR